MSGVININYGKEILSLNAGVGKVLYSLYPADINSVKSFKEEVERALKFPVGIEKLENLVKPGDKIVIVADDLTRQTPTKIIVPIVLDMLNKGGIPDHDISLIIALGTHRAMTQDEIKLKFGDDVVKRINILNHDCFDKDNLKHYGVTRRGTDIWVNKMVVEADFRIGIGNIIPHHPTGWSGGAKILLPGVAGEHTTAQMHLLGATEQLLGEIETPCREEMEDFAKQTGFEFIINTVLDGNGDLVRAVAGDVIDAHREGVKWGMRVCGAPFGQKANISISSSYPVDYDLFQSAKGIFSATRSTKPGGEIILLSPCYEGINPTHEEYVDIALLSDDELFRLFREEFDRYDPLSITAALYFNAVKRLFKVTIVSEGITAEQTIKMGFNHVKPAELQDYLNEIISKETTIGVVHNSAKILPLEIE